jgi:hypothetical protein
LGKYHQIPQDWDIPRCGVRDFWRQLWIGDGIRQIPPLRYISIVDISHLDKKPIAPGEEHGRIGKFKTKRRARVSS